MPRIVCRTCGREVYTTAPLEQLFAEERRCPRCGVPLHADRRAIDRRVANRRVNPPEGPGEPEVDEQRVGDRRTTGRRRGDGGSKREKGGWPE